MHEGGHSEEKLTLNADLQIGLYTTVGLISFLSNTLLFLVLGCNKKLHTKTNLLLVSLALTDWLVIVFGLTINITNLIKHGAISTGMSCKVTGMLVLVPFLVSNFNLTLIAFHRYVLIVKGRAYKKIFSTPKILIYLLVVWLLGILIALPPFFGWGEYSYNSQRAHCMIAWEKSISYLFFVQVVAFPMPLLVMVFSYYKVFSHSYASQKRLRASIDRHNLRKRTKELRLTITLLAVLVVFFVLFLPYAVMIYMEGIFHIKTSHTFSFMAMLFAYSNSMFDFWIYAAMSIKFRRTFLNMIQRCLHPKKKIRITPVTVTSSSYPSGDAIDDLSSEPSYAVNDTPQVSARRRSAMHPRRKSSYYKSVHGEIKSHSISELFIANSNSDASLCKSQMDGRKNSLPAFVVTKHS